MSKHGMHFEWPYYDLINGKLYIRTKRGLMEAFHTSHPPRFETVQEAEDWLKTQDLRGNVR